jgi:Tetratricopeptide repeat
VLQGRLTEAVALFESVLELTEGTDAKVSRIWTGPLHVEALIALGRDDDARRCLEAYAATLAQCQAPFYDAEVARLRERLTT